MKILQKLAIQSFPATEASLQSMLWKRNCYNWQRRGERLRMCPRSCQRPQSVVAAMRRHRTTIKHKDTHVLNLEVFFLFHFIQTHRPSDWKFTPLLGPLGPLIRRRRSLNGDDYTHTDWTLSSSGKSFLHLHERQEVMIWQVEEKKRWEALIRGKITRRLDLPACDASPGRYR